MIESFAPAPAVTNKAPAPVTEYVAPAPVATYTAPAAMVGNTTPAPTVAYTAQGMIALFTPAPAVTYTAQAPLETNTAPTPADECRRAVEGAIGAPVSASASSACAVERTAEEEVAAQTAEAFLIDKSTCCTATREEGQESQTQAVKVCLERFNSTGHRSLTMPSVLTMPYMPAMPGALAVLYILSFVFLPFSVVECAFHVLRISIVLCGGLGHLFLPILRLLCTSRHQ